MINSIEVGKVIYSRLIGDDEIKSRLSYIVNETEKIKIYPLIANEDTTYPYVVYRKENIIPTYNKDGLYEDNVTFSIVVTDINYDTCCEIANRIRGLFESMNYSSNDMNIRNCHLANLDENWVQNAFVQMLSFSCTITQ